MALVEDPRVALDALADSAVPYLLGVRHHSPALAAAVPALLDAAGADVVCVELPADFQPWLVHLCAPGTVAPVALAGAGQGGRLGFYPFADFSPELAAVRWARERGVEVVCCDLPMADARWGSEAPDEAGDPREAVAGPVGPPAPITFAQALTAAGTGRAGDDLWDRSVEVLAPGCAPEGLRRAALGVGWALRQDAESSGGVSAVDLAREAHMRDTIALAASGGRRVAAVIGAFHAPALAAVIGPSDVPAPADGAAGRPPADGMTGRGAPTTEGAAARSTESTETTGTTGTTGSTGSTGSTGTVRPGDLSPVVTSLVPYAFDLLDSRSGYPAGIRDPRWQQAVFRAGGDPDLLHDAAAGAITRVCRELRAAGHTAGTGEAREALRMACDLARLRGLPAPGRSEVLEALTVVLGQGEPLGRGRALARALEVVLVGTERGRVAPGTPRSGLGPSVEAELADLRLPGPDDPAPRELRLDPLRSALDQRREILLRRLEVCGVGYGEPVAVAGTGDAAALSSRWRLSWVPSVPVRLDLAGVRGVTAAAAAEGTLRETFRRESADGGPTCALVLTGLRDAARCDLPTLVAQRLAEAAEVLPASATIPELLTGLDLLEALRRGHLPGTTPAGRRAAGSLAADLLESAVRSLPGLAGSDDPEEAAALVALAARAGELRLGLRMDKALAGLVDSASPLVQGAALACRVLFDLEDTETLGTRAAGWIDTATGPDARRTLARRLTGLLTGAAPLLQSAPTALDPLLDRIDSLDDRGFLDRLPALRGGFDTLTPAGRDRLLHTVTERLGDRLDLALGASPRLLALWTAADEAGRSAAASLRPAPSPDRSTGTPTAGAADSTPAAIPRGSVADAPRDGVPRLSAADRWRLLLGREHDRLPADARRYAHALDELYGTGRGEGSSDLGRDGGRGGGQDASFPTAREWAEELQALFGAEVREEVLARAADRGRSDVLAELDPDAVRPSVDLLTSVLSLAGGLPEQRLARLRPLVRRLVDELAKELATRTRPALTGLATPRPTRRPGGRIDLPRTLRANLVHARKRADGSTLVVPERPVFSTRSRKEADWRLILVVDVSGSMEASVVWSALTAAVLGGVPTLSTHFLAFSTDVIDLTDRVDDPLSLLLEVRVGGGTHIAAGLAHARALVTVPSRTLVVVVSDFEEGYPLGGLLGEVRALASSGVHLLGCAALDDSGSPRYSVPIAQQLVAAGLPVAALSPLALARWVGDRLRGESR
ncbi:vWA domain-containing protein [Streptomyces qinzhouensis]|uniref:VWA domain-containing protein n=1 Tax=Streptomyces qinzhouensis TaxID=2599401 RepID=A0A5B8JIN5_9ACTN|nr:DUF5682 family protein [Streptomyces qinzhouensis]QDY81426.1 VWA domain-containing protein [Streptomyces qinzhouensis]